MEESGEGSPAREHVVDCLGNRGMAREFGALGAHPVFQPGDQGQPLPFEHELGRDIEHARVIATHSVHAEGRQEHVVRLAPVRILRL
jgi:hypothetical protein